VTWDDILAPGEPVLRWNDLDTDAEPQAEQAETVASWMTPLTASRGVDRSAGSESVTSRSSDATSDGDRRLASASQWRGTDHRGDQSRIAARRSRMHGHHAAGVLDDPVPWLRRDPTLVLPYRKVAHRIGRLCARRNSYRDRGTAPVRPLGASAVDTRYRSRPPITRAFRSTCRRCSHPGALGVPLPALVSRTAWRVLTPTAEVERELAGLEHHPRRSLDA